MNFNLKKVGFILILVLIMVFIGFVMLTDRKNRELNNDLNEKINNNINNQNNVNQENMEQNNNNEGDVSQEISNLDEVYENKVVVNSVVDATDKLSFMEYGTELVIEIINGEVRIGNTIKKIDGEKIASITGYYYQPGGVTHLYALTESKRVYVLSYDVFLGIGDRQFKSTDLTNVEKLVLYDVYVYYAGSPVDERNRVYAVFMDKEIQIDSYCVGYNELD